MTGESYWEMKKRLVLAHRFIEGVEKSRSDPSRWEKRAEFFSSANPMCKHVTSMCSHTKTFERNCVVK